MEEKHCTLVGQDYVLKSLLNGKPLQTFLLNAWAFNPINLWIASESGITAPNIKKCMR